VYKPNPSTMTIIDLWFCFTFPCQDKDPHTIKIDSPEI
jgi:hypothetical protein